MNPATQALQEIKTYTGRLDRLPSEYGESLCAVLSKETGLNFDFRKYVGLGGEAIAIKAFQFPNATSEAKDVLAKFCLPTKAMIDATQNPDKSTEHFLKVAGNLLARSKRGNHPDVLTIPVMRFLKAGWIQQELYDLFVSSGFRYGYFPQVFHVGTLKFPFVVMEYIPESNLIVWLENHTKVERLRFFVNLVCMIEEYLHKKRIAHCDLKAENILVKNDKPVLIDFGNHRNKGKEERLTKAGDELGTALYLEDEMIKKSMDRGYQTDIYMLGKLLVVFWNKREPQTRIDFLNDSHLLPQSLYEIFIRCIDKTARLYSDISDLRVDIQMALVDFENQSLSDGRWKEFVQNPIYIPVLETIFTILERKDLL